MSERSEKMQIMAKEEKTCFPLVNGQQKVRAGDMAKWIKLLCKCENNTSGSNSQKLRNLVALDCDPSTAITRLESGIKVSLVHKPGSLEYAVVYKNYLLPQRRQKP